MEIAICDDEIIIVEKIKKIIVDNKFEYNVHINIKQYHSGVELLEAIKKGEKYELIFLDIEMDVLNGLDVGEQIRKSMNDYSTQIAIVSGKNHYSMQAYQINPMTFIEKPFEEIQIVEAVKLAQKIIGNKPRFFVYKFNKDILKVPIEDIYYFEVYMKKITIVCKNQNFEFHSTLKEIELQLKELGFIRISKYLIVNGMYITFVKGNELTMSTGKILNIGRQYRVSLIESLEN